MVNDTSNFIAGKTEDLIENDKLNQLFDSDLIQFNKTLKQFTIKNSQ